MVLERKELLREKRYEIFETHHSQELIRWVNDYTACNDLPNQFEHHAIDMLIESRCEFTAGNEKLQRKPIIDLVKKARIRYENSRSEDRIPKTKFPIFGAALRFPNIIITNYCFSAILKGLKLSSSSTAINLLRSILVPLQRSIPHSSTTASSFVVMFAPKTKFTSFGAALPFPNTIITNYCFSAILKGLKLSSSSSAVNTSQFGQLSVVLLSCLPRKQSFRVLAPLYPFQIQILQTIAFLQF